MDFASLRQLGIQHLEEMTDGQWTDFNVHDPGITILEQLCYALTDLGYRAGHDIPDLLAEGDKNPYDSLHLPAEILSCRPVTLTDLRRAALDVDGVRNAWVEAFLPDASPLYYKPGKTEPEEPGELWLFAAAAPEGYQPVRLKGLYRVLIEAEPDASAGPRERVVRRLHQNRGLCEDYQDIVVPKAEGIVVTAEVEIEAGGDPDLIRSEVEQRLANAISPTVPFITLDEMLQAGLPLDQVFEGPLLDHGFLRSEALTNATRRTAINASDLIHAITDVPGVWGVSFLRFGPEGGAVSQWSLAIDPAKVATLALLDITLKREGRTIAKSSSRPAARAKASTAAPGRPVPPQGRNRHVGRYLSIQSHFPALYGVGEQGPPATASPERRGRIKQFKAYLMFFDQLMANYLEQLAHVKDLFSFDPPDQSHFTQPVDGTVLRLDELRREGPLPDSASVSDTQRPARRQRFLNHLLARFGEAIDRDGDAPAFLRDYPRLGGARGSGVNVLEPEGGLGRSGLEDRIRLTCGLKKEDGEGLLIVEHILLRPMPKHDGGQVLQLAKSWPPDPYSLQLTFVLPQGQGRFPKGGSDKNDFQRFVEQTIRAETPAHLTLYVRWMEPDPFHALAGACKDWRQKHRTYLEEVASGAAATIAEHVPARAARDQLIDLLGFGSTYPLADIGVQARDATVPAGHTTEIRIEFGQSDVEYQLYEGGKATGAASRGSGTVLGLTTPGLTKEQNYTVRAVKIGPPQLAVFLRQNATVKVGPP